jgi:methionyl-tRNA formyltransferase
MNGDVTSGVSIMVLTEGMDEGPVLSTSAVDVGPDETAGDLGGRLAPIGASLLVETLDGYLSGDLEPVEQDHDSATYAAKITNEEAEIDWSAPALQIHNKVRGLSPAPGAWSTFRDKRVKIFRTRVVDGRTLSPGGATLDSGRLVVGTGDGGLVLEEAQLAGKKRMGGADLANGLRPAEGESFG